MRIFSKKTIILGLAGILFAGLLAGYTNREYLDQFPIGCAFKAKTICAAVFVSGRDPAVVEREDTGFSSLLRLFHARINAEDKSVICSLLLTGIYEKKAVHIDGVGSVLLSGSDERAIRRRKPTPSTAEPADPGSVPWPRGDKLPDRPLPAGVDRVKIASAVEALFIEPNQDKKRRTRALVIVHEGHIK